MESLRLCLYWYFGCRTDKSTGTTKKGPSRGPLQKRRRSALAEQGQIGRRLLAITAGLELIGDLIAFIQALQARTLHGRDMDESVLAAVFRRDEAEAFGSIEEFYSTGDDSHRT